MSGISRRGFVALAGSGLVLGLPPLAAGEAGAASGAGLSQPFLRIASSGEITVLIKHLEMGQGVSTGLSTILAEELDADWHDVHAEPAPFNPALYKHTVFGIQTTGGSTSVANSWQQLREAGAVARAMLVQAAAQRWGVPAAELTAHASRVLHGATGRQLSYGALAEAAARLPVPSGVPLKSSAAYSLIGRERRRLGAADMARGAVVYGIDIQRPGQRVAVLQRPPRFGGRVRTVDASAALALPGVRAVHRLPQGVAVVADDSWTAMQARQRLKIDWDDSQAETRSTPELKAEFKRLAASGESGIDTLTRGDTATALAGAARVMEADFELPYLAHQPMEPLAVVGELRDGHCEIWGGFQSPSIDHRAAARILGLPAEQVVLHPLPSGGSFGRRATFSADWVSELAELLRAQSAAGDTQPVKLMWTREDDITGGYYRPMSLHRLRAALDGMGRLLAVEQTIVAQSFSPSLAKPGAPTRPDPFVTEGHLAEAYAVPHARTRWVKPDIGVPVHTYRALGYNHTTFSKEVMMDELARAAGQDALAFRLAHLAAQPRHAAALRLAAERAGWGRPLPAGRALGLAVQEAYKTVVAQVAQVRLEEGRIVVERVVCAVDCGTVINPGTLRAQLEGGIAFGLSAVLHNELTLDGGRVQQSNFHDAAVLRLNEMPQVEVHSIASDAAPTGIGEPGSVPILAAVANAVARLTGRPVRSLPIRLDPPSG
ncbi:xanthine dehydrogenase family protein molybdopterin-binding subunit [Roseateles cellulosilyticus]|uniref:Molybdopterin-dependent oxidoreductase n=1 Tax=Pelomonas cellulosilytica TaxID=2906762 RepID=A0ABS8XQA6_9BURK|nr:molybdopterin cofactor-binding domain-containing protein [Pelomonas sp. P8]MCE4552854.1 molybdopterin-dependent oxidoreductase [Pelomonas sp. P8]